MFLKRNKKSQVVSLDGILFKPDRRHISRISLKFLAAMTFLLLRPTNEHKILVNMANHDTKFLRSFDTEDESWYLEYDPETKGQSAEYTISGKILPIKFCASKSKAKIILILAVGASLIENFFFKVTFLL